MQINEHSAYLLGLLWADGYLRHKESDIRNKRCLYRITLEILSIDFNEIKHCFEQSEFNWLFYERTRPDRKPISSAILHSKTYYNLLSSLNYENKSGGSPSSVLDMIPSNIKHMWWRGYLDGDGCIYVNKIKHLTFGSTYDQDWQFMIDFLNNFNIDKYQIVQKHRNNNSYSTFRMSNGKNIKRILDYIYSDIASNNIGFSRKYEKYKLI